MKSVCLPGVSTLIFLMYICSIFLRQRHTFFSLSPWHAGKSTTNFTDYQLSSYPLGEISIGRVIAWDLANTHFILLSSIPNFILSYVTKMERTMTSYSLL